MRMYQRGFFFFGSFFLFASEQKEKMNKKNFLTPVSQSKQSKKYFNFARRHSDFSRNVGVETPTYGIRDYFPRRTVSLQRSKSGFERFVFIFKGFK